MKTKRAIPAAVVYQIQLLIHSNTGGSGTQILPVEQPQQVSYYYNSDESASPALSYESAEPVSESQSFPSDTDLHYAHDNNESFDSQVLAEPVSPATQQLVHELELSDCQSDPDIYFDSQSTDLSLSSDSSNFSSIQIDGELFSEPDYSDELLSGSSLSFMWLKVL